jgi:hypothetical protein
MYKKVKIENIFNEIIFYEQKFSKLEMPVGEDANSSRGTQTAAG